jgi:MFS family permease
MDSSSSSYFKIVLFGLISLLGDVIYEGARSILPSYLSYLGAGALLIGMIFGLGEVLNVSLRLFSGVYIDRVGAYWQMFILGYILIISIPLISITPILFVVIILILLERVAKALRTPARDTLLSVISRDIGAGKAFGIHELLDQIGAIIGPFFMGLILLIGFSYSFAFSLFYIPFLLLLFLVFYTYSILRDEFSRVFGVSVGIQSVRGLFSGISSSFKLYSIAVMLNTMGIFHWSLILYKVGIYTTPWFTALVYVGIMAVDAVFAFVAGYLYDIYGKPVLLFPFILSALVGVFALYGGYIEILISGILFGIVYGMQESVYRAVVPEYVGLDKRGTAYGLFNFTYGVGLLLSGLIYGFYLENNMVLGGIIYTLVIQVVAIYMLIRSFSK